MKRARKHFGRSIFGISRTQQKKAPVYPFADALESRVFLSGSVVASVVHGKLDVRGDNAANVITIDQAGLDAGQLRISGASGTTINNQTDPIIVNGVARGILFHMGDGADAVTMSNVSLPGNVLFAGQGADTIVLNGVHVAASLDILNSSSVATTTTVVDTTVGRNMVVHGGAGGQNLALQSVVVQGSTNITGGKGVNLLAIDDSIFHGALFVSTGRAADIIQIEAHGDPLGSPTLFDGPVSISTGAGNDSLQLGVNGESGSRSEFSGKVSYRGGTGSNALGDFAASTYLGRSRFQIHRFESRFPGPDITDPTVSSTSPASGATGVALNTKIAATFSERMDPLTITATNVTVTAPGGVPVLGTVDYVGNTMTFTPAAPLALNTTFTLTISTGVKDLAGNPLANSFVSSFTTGAASDTTAPTVVSTSPVNNATGVALNAKVAATFSEPMDPLTITAANVTVTATGGGSVLGTLAFVGNTVTFTPTIALPANTTFTATITTGVKDLAGNPLASNFVWTFATGATADTTAPTVVSTNPADLQTNVFINNTAAATFSEAMDPSTITPATFTLTGSGNTAVAGTVNYDAPSEIATFTPTSNLAPNTTFTATITGGQNGAKDLAGNPLATDKVWTFTTGTQAAQARINLGSASAFAVMATASITGTGPTVINGDVGLNPGSSQGIPPAQVNGTIHVDDQAIITAQSDLLSAYNDAVSRSVTSVTLPGNMGGLTFTPGLYTNSSSVLVQGAGPANNVTLDAQGNPNAIFIFKIGSTLTTGPGAQVILAGGAKASNIFWQVGTSATLNTTTIFKGNILAAVTITVNNGSVVEGRLLGGANSSGSVTVNASTISVPTT